MMNKCMAPQVTSINQANSGESEEKPFFFFSSSSHFPFVNNLNSRSVFHTFSTQGRQRRSPFVGLNPRELNRTKSLRLDTPKPFIFRPSWWYFQLIFHLYLFIFFFFSPSRNAISHDKDSWTFACLYQIHFYFSAQSPSRGKKKKKKKKRYYLQSRINYFLRIINFFLLLRVFW